MCQLLLHFFFLSLNIVVVLDIVWASLQAVKRNCPHSHVAILTFPQKWTFVEPLIRQQDHCLAVTGFTAGSKVKLEPCNPKEPKQVIHGLAVIDVGMIVWAYGGSDYF